MTTANAFVDLGRAIKSDVKLLASHITSRIERKKRERKIIAEFRELLRTEPAVVTKAFAAVADAEEAKPARKPRKPRAAE